MSQISINTIKNAVYNLCFEANTSLSGFVYNKLLTAFYNTSDSKQKEFLYSILKNAKIAYEKKLPLCQDTGQVIVFLEIGQDVHINDGFIYDEINFAVKKCYMENFFRKSVVNNAVFDRTNTQNNLPCIIYTNIIKEDEIRIKVLIKGAGSENKSCLEMLLPTCDEKDIIETTSNLILKSGKNACPPMFIGIGIGATSDNALLLSKKALITNNFSNEEIILAKKIQERVNCLAPEELKNIYVLDVKVLTAPTHIASMPLGISINCHSDRFKNCIIKSDKVFYENNLPDFSKILEYNPINSKEIFTNDIDIIRNLKKGQDILLTGEIYVARDMAHKRIFQLLNKGELLPFDIKNKIIFYAGPCPNKPDEIIGSIGPTTSSRMDKYALDLYKKGLLATIGKGDRSSEVKCIIEKNNARYFTAIGGIAALLSEKVKKSEIIAFPDLGTEAVYKLSVEKLPLHVEI